MEKQLEYPYPKELFDADGYPTDEALEYIRNWGYEKEGDEMVFGKFFSSGNYDELIEYVKGLWNYGEHAYKHEDGMFELHTIGWSGNESIIYELKNTILWSMKFRAQLSGGHYYFRLDSKCGYDWNVVKEESKW
jgi:hypothetical protein